MQSLIRYFANVPDVHRVLLLTVSIAFFWWLEHAKSLVATGRSWHHALTNATFVFTGAIVQLFFGYALLNTLNWTAHHHWGLVRLLPVDQHPVLDFALSFLLLDLLEYTYHVFMHRYGYLWRFHAVHHADPAMDVSTVLREHPGETAIRLAFLTVWVFISGITFWALMARQFIQIVSNVAAHAHLRLPEQLDRVLSWVLVTPNMHHVHHHEKQPYTDSNYGDVLSIWDRLFSTFRRMRAEQIVFGLDTVNEPVEGVSFGHLLMQPFQGRPTPKSPDSIPFSQPASAHSMAGITNIDA
ncbi:sterol desaturase family protein [Spirosoma sordidisoli]|uniref:Sterol desaturase family protein n=1 Tax=Spirosoma sordidisoli TaxID=2502893 RepID=A0A4Q2UCG8_9BACT|nr:sterol desaturase family protein [Spirosoma sordidisoli]RYC66717.1 sterol desaturase family protein [Spirosoma sordidisoli]